MSEVVLINENIDKSNGINTAIKKERYNFIDLLEFIAIFFVVLYHSTIYALNFLQESSFLYYLRYFLRALLSTCCPLFFVANGFLLFQKEFNLKKHLFKILKFLILMAIWGLITTLFLMLIRGESLSFNQILEYSFTLKQTWTNHLWFLRALICIYLIFPLLKIAFDKHNKIFIYFIIICFIFSFGSRFLNMLVSVFSNFIFNYQINLNFNLFSYFSVFGPYAYSFVYFCLGGLLYLWLPKIMEISVKKRNIVAVISIVISCTLLFLFGVFTSFNQGSIYDIVWEGYDTIFTLINVIAIFILCINYKGKFKFLNNTIKNISGNTLGIYFIHLILIDLTKGFIKQVPILCSFWFAVIYSFAIILICFGLSYLIKKIPILKKIL